MTFFGELLIESCNRQVSQKVRGVLPRFSVANPLLAQNVMDRFVYGMTVGSRCSTVHLNLKPKPKPLIQFHK